MTLATHMLVSAALQFCQNRGEGAYVLRRGDRTAGAILLRHSHRDGTSTLYVRRYAMEGGMVWEATTPDAAPLPDADADDYIGKRAKTDPDLWAIELETTDIAAVLEFL